MSFDEGREWGRARARVPSSRRRNVPFPPFLPPPPSFLGRTVAEHRGALALSHPVEHGQVQSWADMEALWTHLYASGASSSSSSSPSDRLPGPVRPSDHPVLLVEPPHASRAQRERAAQFFLETLRVPALAILPSPPLALYASGRTTGLVVECGDGVTSATPVYEGFAVAHAVSRADYGGADVTRQLSLLLRKSGVASLHTAAEGEAVRGMKESCCYVAPNPREAEGLAAEGRSPAAEYTLPDGTRLTLGAERFRAPEALFRPSLLGLEHPGVGDLAAAAVGKADLDLRAALLGSVLLAGGATTTRGFGARLLTELRRASPQESKVRVWAPQDRAGLVWVGGSILASLSTFQKLWVGRAEWEEAGGGGGCARLHAGGL